MPMPSLLLKFLSTTVKGASNSLRYQEVSSIPHHMFVRAILATILTALTIQHKLRNGEVGYCFRK